MTIDSVRAMYSKGAIVPLQQLDIEEGAHLSISIEVEPRVERAERGLRALRATAGKWKDRGDADVLIQEIYEARLVGSKYESVEL